jgi:hypothetical protein
MKLPAVAMATAFALGITCGLKPVIAHRSSSHEFVTVLLCTAASSLLIGIFFVWRSSLVGGACVAVVLGSARRRGSLHPGTAEAFRSCFESSGCWGN